ncbi:LrgB family protein [Nereida sp. MMG025]|uniref:LrgB family protein n=1 Tax=Nereida sp. MMG025 TaxID=2909981 RepID=UPI001F2E4125|nr:LrgB family protein [Nereida sp. MMG025]MCF6444898.1 LrgB family protein [Nereida sp. MMG025]
MTDVSDIWIYLSQEPLLWLTATLVCYLAGDTVSRLCKRHPIANPVLIAVALLAAILWATGTPYATYFEGAQFVHFMLGPATVALAIPLYNNLHHLKATALPLIAALVAGSTTALLTAVGIGMAFGLPLDILLSLAPKSTTAPVAIGIANEIGGSATLTAVLVILTGVIGAITVTTLMNALRITDYRARGLAAGVAAHGIGTARAFQVNETAGAFAGVGMGLNALLTALIAPYIMGLLF